MEMRKTAKGTKKERLGACGVIVSNFGEEDTLYIYASRWFVIIFMPT